MTRRFSSKELKFLRNRVPIERVMHQRKIGFVDSVKWLQRRMPPVHPETTSTNENGNAGPCAIGDILSHVMPSPSQSKTDATPVESIVQKISRLELRLRHLDRLVSQLQSYQ